MAGRSTRVITESLIEKGVASAATSSPGANRLSAAETLKRQREYWQQKLSTITEAMQLPTDRLRPAVQSYTARRVRLMTSAALVASLRKLAGSQGVTLHVTLLSAWAATLKRWSGCEDVVICLRLPNRGQSDSEQATGLFENSAVLVVPVRETATVEHLLAQVSASLAELRTHLDVPFEQVIEAQGAGGAHGRFAQVTMRLDEQAEAVAASDAAHSSGSVSDEEIADGGFTASELSLSLRDSGAGLAGTLEYASELFDRETIERMVSCWEALLQSFVADSARLLVHAPLLTHDQLDQLQRAFNDTAETYPRGQVIHELFEEQVRQSPHSLAVTYQQESLTYAELNRRANQLAWYLRCQNLGPEQLVAICFERGIPMVVAVLGVLKAGGAYLPLDPSYPPERLEYMLRDASPSIVVTQQQLKANLPETGARLIALDSDWHEIAAQPETNIPPDAVPLHASNLAYVIYTSGSTGKPKGVLLEHAGLCNLAYMQRRHLHVRRDSRVLQFASLSFDACTWECFMALSSGACLCLASRDELALGEALLQTLRTQGITHATLPPVALAALSPCEDLPLSTLVVAGEACAPALVRQWSAGRQFVNAYGPTEATVCASMHVCQLQSGGNVPIGRPIANAKIHILDRYRRLVPIGVIGEIHIGGAGIGRGYLNRRELTAEKFIADPFGTAPSARLYKSGDLGRWRPDGTIEFLGRNDDQVKIRGFRVELGEIEAQLCRHEQVREVIVVPMDDGDGPRKLVAYVARTEQGNPQVEELRAHLSALLPNYMVPSAYVILERFPLTPSGKVDRRALPAPGFDAYARQQYEAPQGEVEEILAGIWQELLRVDRVSRHDNFFQLGGHSLLIVHLLEQLRRVGLSTEASRVYGSPTLADLARALTHEASDRLRIPPNLIPLGCTAITPEMLPMIALEREHIERVASSVPGGAANIQDIYPLTSQQEGILFHHEIGERSGDIYVIPVLLQLSSRQALDAFVRALQQVVDRYDTLRTAFLAEGLPQPLQVVYRRATLPVEEVSLQFDRGCFEQLEEWLKPERQSFDVRRAPLLRLRIAADVSGGKWFALLQHHHVVADHASVETMFADVKQHIEGAEQVLPAPMPYRNHVAQVLEHAKTGASGVFFRKKLGDISEPTASFDLRDVHGDGARIVQYNEALEPALSQRVRSLARRLGVSAATLFHVAWGLVVARTSGRDEIVFGTVLLGRLRVKSGTRRDVGMYVNTLPLRLSLESMTARDLVEHTQRELIELLDHEQAPLSEAQRCSGVAGRTPLFNTLLNYLHSSVPIETGQPVLAPGVQVLAAREWTNYPITISVVDQGEGFVLDVATDRQIQPQRIATYMERTTRALVDALERAPQTPALALSVLPDSELRQVLESFNATHAIYPRGKLIHELFEEQVHRSCHAIAVVYDAEAMTYADLNGRANQLARYLRSKGVGPGQLVALCVERSLDMVVALLGILKSGAAYVPLDPSYPPERLQYMLADAAPRIVLTQEKLKNALHSASTEIIALDSERDEFAREDARNLPRADLGPAEQNLVYVIYTSGSTGRPKGTAMSHGAMVNLIEWHRRTLGEHEGRRVLQFAALGFDVAFQETFSTLCTGGVLVLLDEWARRDARALTDVLSKQRIQRVFLPPLMLQTLAEHLNAASKFPAIELQDVITAGEQLRITGEISKFLGRLRGCRLHNHYGPTETHVVTALTLIGPPEHWPAIPCIGKPIANTQIYVTDRHCRPVPIGVTGEIYIGGVGVARGYLQRPELTAQRFVANTVGTQATARLYKTGDLGRWRVDGTLEYLGRNDDQVKVRGYRIELGEIETLLQRHERVRDAVVLAREDVPGQRRLVAYFTQHEGSSVDAEEFRAYLRAALPEFMVPSAFVRLKRLPLTPNGKLDRRALPEPDLDALANVMHEPPRGQIEEVVAEIWRELLHVERVGRRDNFFDLGGHSLLASRVITYIGSALEVDIPLRVMVDEPTVEALGKFIVKEISAELSMEAS